MTNNKNTVHTLKNKNSNINENFPRVEAEAGENVVETMCAGGCMPTC